MTRALARLTRRAILKITLSVSGGLTLYGLARFLARGEPPPTPRQFPLGYPQDYAVGSLTPIPEARALLLHDERGFFALSSTCTHLGCTLGTDASPLECPCHGSRFNQQGQVTHGPASQSLCLFELSLTSDGRILLNTGATVAPDVRLSSS